MIYMSFGTEIDTDPLIQKMLQDKKSVYLPVTYREDRSMVAAKFISKDELIPGDFGILTHNKDNMNTLDKNNLDLIIVPGVGFDRRGYRIGHGGGYYDRFLEDLDADLISIIYDQQLIDKVPDEDHDVPVDILITPTQTIYTKDI